MAELPELTFTYGTVEKALAVAYRIPEERRAVGFRATLSNVQKLGVLGLQSRVGRGRKLAYTPVEMHRLLLALELCELGIPPGTAAAIIETCWKTKLEPIVDAAERGLVHGEPGGDDVIMCLVGGAFRTGSLRGETVPGVNVARCSIDTLPLEMKQWMTVTPDDPAPPRALVVNLSARLRAFHDALADENLTDALAERRQAALREAKQRKGLSRLKFQFAKTMPETPHWYVVRTPKNEADYVTLFHVIQEKGVQEKFGTRRYRYWRPGDGFKYWAMTTDVKRSRVINRAKVEAAE